MPYGCSVAVTLTSPCAEGCSRVSAPCAAPLLTEISIPKLTTPRHHRKVLIHPIINLTGDELQSGKACAQMADTLRSSYDTQEEDLLLRYTFV